jgi:hypothetical protein
VLRKKTFGHKMEKVRGSWRVLFHTRIVQLKAFQYVYKRRRKKKTEGFAWDVCG